MLKLKRDYTVQEVSISNDEFDIAFSSETPVERQILDEYGSPVIVNEILMHDGPHNADLERINNNAALLFNHDFDAHLGVVIPGSVRIDKDRIGRAKVKFSQFGELANEIKAKVLEKTISKISFGYDILNYSLRGNDLMVDKWSPYEISFVTVPADDKVGLGRLLNTDNETTNITVEGKRMFENMTIEELQKLSREQLAEMNIEEIESMPEELRIKREEMLAEIEAENAEIEDDKKDAIEDKQEGDKTEAEIEAEKAAEIEAQEAERVKAEKEKEAETEMLNKEKERVAEIEEIASRYKVSYENVKSAIDGKVSVSDFKRSIKPNNSTTVVRKMSDTQKTLENKFNFGEAIRSLMADKALTGAAAEYTQEMSRKRVNAGLTPNGRLYLPVSALQSARAINSVPTVSAIQPETMDNGSFVEMLLKPTVLGKLGVNFQSGLTQRYTIPKMTKSSVDAFGFVDENGESPEGESTFTNIQFAPKTFTGGNPITRQALETTPNIESLISDHIVKHSRVKLQQLMFGSVSDAKAPASIVAQLAAKAMGMTYKEFVVAASEAEGNGVDMAAFKYLVASALSGDLKTTLRDAGVSGYIIGDDNKLGGVDALSTGLLAPGKVLAGDFSAITVAEWDGLALDLDDTTYRNKGAIVPRVWADIDWKITADDRLFLYEKTGA
ncbi:major capsid protein [Escherichia coli]|nr:major capsid protein [Escherichia coli]